MIGLFAGLHHGVNQVIWLAETRSGAKNAGDERRFHVRAQPLTFPACAAILPPVLSLATYDSRGKEAVW